MVSVDYLDLYTISLLLNRKESAIIALAGGEVIHSYPQLWIVMWIIYEFTSFQLVFMKESELFVSNK